MAYIVNGSNQIYEGGAAAVHTPADSIAFVNAVDDILIMGMSADSGVTVSINPSTGWNVLRNVSSGGVRQYVAWRRATGANEDVPEITLGSAESMTLGIMSIRGCPTGSTPIGNSASNTGSGDTLTWTSISNSAKSVILYFGVLDADTIITVVGKPVPCLADAGGDSGCIGYEYLHDAGTTGTVTGLADLPDGWQTFTLELLDDGSSSTPIWFNQSPYANISNELVEEETDVYADALVDSGVNFWDGSSIPIKSFDASTAVAGSTNGDSGSALATVASNRNVTDSSKSWTTDQWKNWQLTISSGADQGTYIIIDNDATSLRLKNLMTATASGLSYTIDKFDYVTITSHGLTESDIVRMDNNGNTLPTGLTHGDYYYIVPIDVNSVGFRTCPVPHTANGDYPYNGSETAPKAQVDITAAGTGTCNLEVCKIQVSDVSTTGGGRRPPGSHDTGLQWCCIGFEFSTAKDLSGGLAFSCEMDVTSDVQDAFFIFIDSDSDWKSWQISSYANNDYLRDEYFQIDPADTNYKAEGGTFNSAAIKYVVMAMQRRSVDRRVDGYRFNFSTASEVRTIKAVGAASTSPGTIESIYYQLRFYTDTTSSKTAGVQVYQFLQPIQFGNGHLVGDTDTFIQDSAAVVTFPEAADGTTKFRNYVAGLGFTFDYNAASSFILRNSYVGAAAPFTFAFDSDYPSGATFDMTGSVLARPAPVLDADGAIDSVVFSGGDRPTLNTATVTNCTFTDIDDADGYILLTTSDNVSDCKFRATENASDYAIEIAAAGTYALNGITYTGFTTDLNISASSGTVTINLDADSDVPTYDTAGATVVINPPSLSFEVTSIPDTVGAETRLQIYNTTAQAADAWAATTVYSEGDMVLRSTGVGTENTAGLFFRCSDSGTSGGTEPTWDTTPGNTTSDGTVEWTCYKILFHDVDPAGTSVDLTYYENEDWKTGEAYLVQFAELDSDQSYCSYSTSGVMGAAGAALQINETCSSVYATNAIDGSSAAIDAIYDVDTVNGKIIFDANLDFTNAKSFAYYCYQTTTSSGMYYFFGAVEARSTAEYYNDVSVSDIKFEATGGFVKQEDGDTSRWHRSDGAKPYIEPPTASYGLSINWKNPVYLETVGSGVLPSDITDIADAVWDELIAGHAIAGSAGEALAAIDTGVNVTQVAGTDVDGPNDLQAKATIAL